MADELGAIERAVQQLPDAVSAWLQELGTGKADSQQSALPPLLRTLRNAPAAGPDAAAALVQAGAPAALAAAAEQILGQEAGGDQPDASGSAGAAQTQGPLPPHLLGPVLVAQALSNVAMSSQAAAEAVWKAAFPKVLLQLVSHAAVKVHEPATAALYACCRSSPAHSSQLCSPAGKPVLAALLRRAVDHGSWDPNAPVGGSLEGPKDQGGCSEWLQLLVGCVAFRHGLLAQLLACLGGGGDGDSAEAAGGHASGHEAGSGTAHASALAWGPLSPVALHVLALEARDMKGGAAPAAAAAEEEEAGAGQQAGRGHEAAPWFQALRCLLYEVVAAAARQSAASRSSAQPSPSTAAEAEAAAAAPATSGAGSAAAGGAAGAKGLAPHVLEAGLEVLKALGARDDRGKAVTGGQCEDPVSLMVEQQGLILQLLGLLSELQPIQNPRRAATAATATATATATAAAAAPPAGPHPTPGASASAAATPAASAPSPQPDGPPEAQQPAAPVLPVVPSVAQYAAGMPRQPPYLGYRGDVLAALANAMFERPAAAEQVAAQPGAIELLLSQCQLDDTSPLAREWALWCVRNLCAGSEAAREHIAAMKPVGAVETPELQKLGLKMEFDAKTARMKVVRTGEEGAAGPAGGAQEGGKVVFQK